MKTFLLKHIWFNNQNSNNYFLTEIHLSVVFSHFLYQVYEKPRIYPKSTPGILKVITSVQRRLFIITFSNNILFRIAILKFYNKKLFLFEKNNGVKDVPTKFLFEKFEKKLNA